MAYEFACPNCAKTVSASTELVGRTVACPYCTRQFSVPAPGRSAEPLPAVLAAKVGGISFTFVCQRCSSILEGQSQLCGQTGRCPTCGATFIIPHVDPRTGLARGPAIVAEDGQLPTPVHAYASAGDKAPRIERQRDGTQVILCPRCDKRMPIDSNLCSGCGLPFTMDGAAVVSQTLPSTNSLATAAMWVGIAGLVTFCMVFPGPLAIALGIAGLQRSQKLGPAGHGRAAATAGIVLGAVSTVLTAAMVLW